MLWRAPSCRKAGASRTAWGAGVLERIVNLAGKATVLLLDEDQLALELYSRELGLDYLVITSESVPETRQTLKDKHLDVLILEPQVNEDEGWILLEEIRLITDPPSVILCSTEDERKAGLDLGASYYLVKPVLPQSLHRLVDQLMAKKANQIA
jgi:DNA-binding response OmpR family regulator